MGKLRTWAPGDLARMTNEDRDEIEDFMFGRNYPGPPAPFGGVGLVVEAGPVDETGQQDVLLDFSGKVCWATSYDLELLS